MTNVADYAILIIVATSVITLNKNLMTHKGAFYMSNVKHTITDSEYSIMKILWGSENKMTVSDVVKALDGNDWTPSTVSTFLQRLLKKNVVSCEKKGNTNLYYPILKQNDYDMFQYLDVLQLKLDVLETFFQQVLHLFYVLTLAMFLLF